VPTSGEPEANGVKTRRRRVRKAEPGDLPLGDDAADTAAE
jgi:hypothetical protein